MLDNNIKKSIMNLYIVHIFQLHQSYFNLILICHACFVAFAVVVVTVVVVVAAVVLEGTGANFVNIEQSNRIFL